MQAAAHTERHNRVAGTVYKNIAAMYGLDVPVDGGDPQTQEPLGLGDVPD